MGGGGWGEIISSMCDVMVEARRVNVESVVMELLINCRTLTSAIRNFLLSIDSSSYGGPGRGGSKIVFHHFMLVF